MFIFDCKITIFSSNSLRNKEKRYIFTLNLLRIMEILYISFGGDKENLYFCSIKLKFIIMRQNLNYSTKSINRNFRIKVCGHDASGKRINKLVGVAGAIALIGIEMLNKLLKRAFACMEDVCVCKLRRGIKFSFYAK